MPLPFLGVNPPTFQGIMNLSQMIQNPDQRRREMEFQAALQQAQQQQAMSRQMLQSGMSMLQANLGRQEQPETEAEKFRKATTRGTQEEAYIRGLPQTRATGALIRKERSLTEATKAGGKEFIALKNDLASTTKGELAFSRVRQDYPEAINFEAETSGFFGRALRGGPRFLGGAGAPPPKLKEAETGKVNMSVLRKLIIADHEAPFRFPQQGTGLPAQQRTMPAMPQAKPVIQQPTPARPGRTQAPRQAAQIGRPGLVNEANVVRKGVDAASGRSVGTLRDGRTVYLDTGEEYNG